MYKIGLYEREITPFFGNSIEGYFNVRIVDGVKDKTYAKAVVIERENKKVALLAIDACMLEDKTMDCIRERVEKYTGINAKDLMISATHSHTAGPSKKDVEGADNQLDSLYLDAMINICADTVIMADKVKREAKIKFTYANVDGISFIRNYLLKNGVVRTNPGYKNPDIVKPVGEKDTVVPVLFFEDKDQNKMGLAYSFACHQDCVDGTEISGDYSSTVSRLMKEKFGMDFISVYFNGTSGNINHFAVLADKDVTTIPDYYKLMGEKVYSEIIKSLDGLTEVDGQIKVATVEKTYDSRVPNHSEIKEQQDLLNSVDLPKDVKLDASSPKEWFDACMAKRALGYTFSVTKYYRVKLQIIKIGDVMIFALPGEVFSQFGLKIKNAFKETKNFFATLSNNKWSYMPEKDCYLPQLYESLYGSALFSPEDTSDIFDSVIELGKTL